MDIKSDVIPSTNLIGRLLVFISCSELSTSDDPIDFSQMQRVSSTSSMSGESAPWGTLTTIYINQQSSIIYYCRGSINIINFMSAILVKAKSLCFISRAKKTMISIEQKTFIERKTMISTRTGNILVDSQAKIINLQKLNQLYYN